MTIRGAGVLCMVNGRVLFLKRAPTADHPGEWCLPGGRVEDGETPEQAARREFKEETGVALKGDLLPWTRRVKADPPGAVISAPPASVEATARAQIEAANGNPAAAPVAPPTAPAQAPEVEPVDFTTFAARGMKPFDPEVNDEHVGYAWAPPDQPPEPLHPGCRVALARLALDELGVARLIAAGELASPQRYETLWLFDLRVTGTGTAYRKKLDEYAYRRPEHYLNPEFLARCNGLPVVWEHPTRATLNSKEFADRVIGTILLPYIKGDEVWGVAKIYDEAAGRLMETEQLSTSPAVVFRDPSVNDQVKLEDGSTLLIEGKPSLLDHLAVCEVGVWDKGKAPSGVRTEAAGDLAMADAVRADADEKREDAAKRKDEFPPKKGEDEGGDKADKKADADAGDKLDTILAGLGSVKDSMKNLHDRMDAMEAKDKARDDAAKRDDKHRDDKARDDKARDDASRKKDDDEDGDDEKAADKKDAKRRDAEEPDKKEPARGDGRKRDDDDEGKEDAKKDSAGADVLGRLARVERLVPMQLSDKDYHDLADAQSRADDVMCAFGERAPRPLVGESLAAYRLRVANKLKTHSPAWKDVNLGVVAADGAAFTIAERQIYADSVTAANAPTDLQPGQMREVHRVNPATGGRVTMFFGKNTFIAGLSRPARKVGRIVTRQDA